MNPSKKPVRFSGFAVFTGNAASSFCFRSGFALTPSLPGFPSTLRPSFSFIQSGAHSGTRFAMASESQAFISSHFDLMPSQMDSTNFAPISFSLA